MSYRLVDNIQLMTIQVDMGWIYILTIKVNNKKGRLDAETWRGNDIRSENGLRVYDGETDCL